MSCRHAPSPRPQGPTTFGLPHALFRSVGVPVKCCMHAPPEWLRPTSRAAAFPTHEIDVRLTEMDVAGRLVCRACAQQGNGCGLVRQNPQAYFGESTPAYRPDR